MAAHDEAVPRRGPFAPSTPPLPDLSPFVSFSRSSLDILASTYRLLESTRQYTVHFCSLSEPLTWLYIDSLIRLRHSSA